MRYLKISLMTIICLSAVCLAAKLYAEPADYTEPPNRADIRAMESTAQIPEAVYEAQDNSAARAALKTEYEKLPPAEKVGLEAYLKNRAATLNSVESSSTASNSANVSPRLPDGLTAVPAAPPAPPPVMVVVPPPPPVMVVVPPPRPPSITPAAVPASRPAKGGEAVPAQGGQQ